MAAFSATSALFSMVTGTPKVVLVDDSSVAPCHVVERLQATLHDREGLLGGCGLHQRREAREIGEDHGGAPSLGGCTTPGGASEVGEERRCQEA